MENWRECERSGFLIGRIGGKHSLHFATWLVTLFLLLLSLFALHFSVSCSKFKCENIFEYSFPFPLFFYTYTCPFSALSLYGFGVNFSDASKLWVILQLIERVVVQHKIELRNSRQNYFGSNFCTI